MEVTAQAIQELRTLTGAGIMDIKKALVESNGNTEAAIKLLREQGKLKALKKQERETKEGIIEAYIHANSQVGSMIELNCETDFVARNKEFQELAHNIVLQVAALNPQYIAPEDVPQEVIEREKMIYQKQLEKEKKPANVLEKIIIGKLEKFFSEVCLVKQKFFKDEKITIEELITSKIGALGENIQVRRIVRMSIK
ncbi:MAG: translation elongation factor Ts [Candidatus Kerfeldbacteria bacterium RIFCSPHIGHO2_02_FULL_42_14]|uniref:Elongation factor Ts n=1 Tax=Candidatus Kerfeldbacteria bacterium RIFCSPHIGHO2_02_FULL_42_14 TaxID=1798540 RepID=A0A1G2APU3_9BACT|nr:MAG: translation elongation factor Ts [Candidatus Kerfeldbacteria bacterium RIFCSPHIGHO2_02_FULL_42_14]OGY81032.1 MAG: translation elongation factor Ts [Candidatus Kerfeldbacteria bacterium RIFCSPHIGHO2_12_FULL_42_13]OGY84849.1 MAG: translation elongation factor Ts [Candidatus Kerfeldbacteria bacterium RIFCSPLOWO2_02_FULL_42_19]OGY85653.1 MAG: translation elongation factor Ts [Candidatus Kerfeldbacteria bacterium RIFCSPLOWO2_12_FULL_43_9]